MLPALHLGVARTIKVCWMCRLAVTLALPGLGACAEPVPDTIATIVGVI